jgi:hypothetical protein
LAKRWTRPTDIVDVEVSFHDAVLLHYPCGVSFKVRCRLTNLKAQAFEIGSEVFPRPVTPLCNGTSAPPETKMPWDFVPVRNGGRAEAINQPSRFAHDAMKISLRSFERSTLYSHNPKSASSSSSE